MSSRTDDARQRQCWGLEFHENIAPATFAFWDEWKTDRSRITALGFRPQRLGKRWFVTRGRTTKTDLRSLGLGCEQWTRPVVNTVGEVLRALGIKINGALKHSPEENLTTCPMCSSRRRRIHQRQRCLAVRVSSRDIKFICNHCGWSGRRRL
jgi:hypothetical protein